MGGRLRRAGVWGQKRLGGRRTLSTGAWRAAKRKSEQADDWGGGVGLFWENAWGRQDLRRRKLRV